MLTALTPPGTAAQGRRVWLVSVTAYTVSGAAASVAVGALLALLGRLAGASLSNSAVLATAGALAGLVAARELSRGRLPLLQPRRMSSRAWARLGQPQAAILWGLDIGAFFTTRMTFAGAWWLAGITVLSADVGLATAVFAAYWLGRASPVWLGPWLVTSATITPRLAMTWSALEPRFRVINAGAVLAGTAALMIAFSG